ncbi:MAG: hypothetical protein V1839_00350 [archaeon]
MALKSKKAENPLFGSLPNIVILIVLTIIILILIYAIYLAAPGFLSHPPAISVLK